MNLENSADQQPTPAESDPVADSAFAAKLEQIRAEKLQKIRELGLDPWGHRFDDREPIRKLRERAPADHAGEMTPARTAGRIIGLRDGGKSVFIDLRDQTDRIQVFLGKKQVGEEAWKLVSLLDLWDRIGIEGKLGRTRTNEITIFAEKLTFLGKTLAHPPDKYHGAQDIELRLRRRYIDMVQDPVALQRFESRSKIVQTIRQYLAGEGFVEVETPTMQAIAGGAAARPFITHHNTLDVDFYLRIALELYLKRLLVGGMERVFEIGRVWRNEGIDASHNPEFTMMELYEAYGDYHRMMDLTEGMIVAAAKAASGGTTLPYGDKQIDLTPPFRRATYDELLKEHSGVSMTDKAAVLAEASKRGIQTAGKDPDVVVSELFEATVEDHLHGPVFVMDYPAAICPLTKRKTSNPQVAERFELFIAGMEIANAYTELNDPLLQEELFTKQLAGQKEEDSMAKMDHDFVLALKHGMPPAGGLGVGIDRLAMLLTNSQTIRDVIIFPLLRPEKPQGIAGNAGASGA